MLFVAGGWRISSHAGGLMPGFGEAAPRYAVRWARLRYNCDSMDEPQDIERDEAARADKAGGDEPLEFARSAARIATEQRTLDVEILDLRGVSTFADFFVIGTGTSDRQMHAVMDFVREHAARVGRKPFKVSDSRSAHWMLADYVDVVIHLFDEQHRDYYDLAGLWGDAPRIQWKGEGEAAE